MKHLFGLFIICIIVVVGFFSVKSLIFGWSTQITDSSFIPVTSESTNTNCDDGEKVKFDAILDGTILKSKNFKFEFSLPSGWEVLDSEEDPDTGLALIRLSNYGGKLKSVFTPTKPKNECFAEEKKALDAVYSSSDINETVKEHGAGHVLEKMGLGANTFKVLDHKTFTSNGNNYYEDSVNTPIAKSGKIIYEKHLFILSSSKIIYMFIIVSLEKPISQDIVDEIISNFKTN